jgi:hypothetical protein
MAWVLAAGCAWLCSPASTSAAESLDGPKEFTVGCVAEPFPVVPRGAQALREFSDASGNVMRVILWRQACSGGDSQALVTFVPLAGAPRVGTARVSQDGRGARQADLLSRTAPLVFLFGAIDAPVTAVLSVNLDPPFDDDCTFTLDYLPPDATSASPLTLAGEPGADCRLDFGAQGAVLSSRLSGTWSDPTREGEGAVTDFFVISGQRVAFMSWYTYEGGQQRYLIGNGTYAAGDRSVRIGLVETGGAQFGSAFRADQVTRRPWGEATLNFADCGRLAVAWRRADGVSGALNLRRVGVADGVACP